MKTTLTQLTLALASLGLFSGTAAPQSAGAGGPVAAESLTPIRNAIREQLRSDPTFAELARWVRRRVLAAMRTDDAEDALEDAILKTWKGRPEIFLRPRDEVRRYLARATRCNLLTERERGRRAGAPTDPDTLSETTPWQGPEPAELALGDDLREALSDRLAPDARAILDAYLAGATSQRDAARATGLTRYAAGRATRALAEALEELLAD